MINESFHCIPPVAESYKERIQISKGDKMSVDRTMNIRNTFYAVTNSWRTITSRNLHINKISTKKTGSTIPVEIFRIKFSLQIFNPEQEHAPTDASTTKNCLNEGICMFQLSTRFCKVFFEMIKKIGLKNKWFAWPSYKSGLK